MPEARVIEGDRQFNGWLGIVDVGSLASPSAKLYNNGGTLYWSGTALSQVGHNHVASDIISGQFADARISQSSVVQHESAITHDNLNGFVLDEHRSLDDASTTTTNLWSADKISTELSGKSDTGHNHSASDITAGTFADARISQSSVTQHQGAIDHDSLANFVLDEHRALDDASTTTTNLWSADKISSELSGKVDTSRTLSTGDGLAGGGDLTQDRSLRIDINGLTSSTNVDAANDWLALYDASVGGHIKVHPNDLGIGGGGADSLDDLSDVSASSPGSNAHLRYNSGTNTWVPDSALHANNTYAAVGTGPSSSYKLWVTGSLRWDGSVSADTNRSLQTHVQVNINGTWYWIELYGSA